MRGEVAFTRIEFVLNDVTGIVVLPPTFAALGVVESGNKIYIFRIFLLLTSFYPGKKRNTKK